MLHAALLCSAGLPAAPTVTTVATPPSAVARPVAPETSKGMGGGVVAEEVVREKCRWLMVLVLRLLRSRTCPYSPPCSRDDSDTCAPAHSCLERVAARSSCCAAASPAEAGLFRGLMVSVADAILAGNWLLEPHEQREAHLPQQQKREGDGKVAGRQGEVVCSSISYSYELLQ